MASSEPSWHPEALQEAREARDWYASKSALAIEGQPVFEIEPLR